MARTSYWLGKCAGWQPFVAQGKPALRAASRFFELISLILLFSLLVIPAFANLREDAAADAVAAAFVRARQDAKRPELERMGRNKFREKICKKDFRFAAGLISDVKYETSAPGDLPDSARELAAWNHSGAVAARFGVGVCEVDGAASGKKFAVIIVLYESRWESFWRAFD
jgi:hypothetical protein